LLRLELLDHFAAVAHPRDHVELGPGLGQYARQRLAQQLLVVGYQHGDGRLWVL
jgi:hypothetical protein